MENSNLDYYFDTLNNRMGGGRKVKQKYEAVSEAMKAWERLILGAWNSRRKNKRASRQK